MQSTLTKVRPVLSTRASTNPGCIIYPRRALAAAIISTFPTARFETEAE